MSLEHHEPDAVDAIVRVLGYEDIDQALEAQRSKDRQRLLDLARERGGITLFHQTTCERARQIERDGFKL